MVRTVFTFLFGLVTGATLVLLLDRPVDVGQLRQDAGAAVASAGRGARDLALQTSVRAALALQRDFSLMGGIVVDASEGRVTLSGKVASEDQRKLAELITRGVDGVESVDNHLEIEPE